MAQNIIDNRNQRLGLNSESHHGIEKRYNYIFNSNTGTLIYPDSKSKFIVNFTNTLNFPEDSTGIQIALHSANVYNTVPNIVTGQYDTITFIIDGDEKTLTLPQGGYSACDIQNTINELLAEAYAPDEPTITILVNNATQTLSIQFNDDNMQIDWSKSTLGFVLGFDKNIVEPALPGPAPAVIVGNAEARLNWAITNFLIVCPDLVGDGLPLNSTGVGILGQTPILAPPGSLIVYEAQNPIWIQADRLIGDSITELVFELTNERNEKIIMSDDWNFTVIIKITS